MFNLCYGMKTINITQLPGGSYSHPNYAVDLAGEDAGIDVWRAVGNWRCTAGPWGNNTFFFVSCDASGNHCKVRCADGRDRVITLALTHGAGLYVRPQVGKVYRDGQVMYEEGRVAQPGQNVTGNHIHAEIAEGVQVSKHYDSAMGVYRMNHELNILKYMFVCRERSVIKSTKGAVLPVCYTAKYQPGIIVPEGKDMLLDIVAKKEKLNIRKSLTFSGGKNTSPVLYCMPKGSRAAVTHFTERFEADGYEWAQVSLVVDDQTINGYVQLDTKSYIIKVRR